LEEIDENFDVKEDKAESEYTYENNDDAEKDEDFEQFMFQEKLPKSTH